MPTQSLNAEGLITLDRAVKSFPNISAIYMIVNIDNDKFYIGSAVNVRKRLTFHKSQLNRGIHDNKHLQGAWKIYGENAFIFLILEKVDLKDLEVKEQHWIDILKANNGDTGYNLRAVANSNQGHKWSEASKIKLANVKKGKPRSEETKEKLRQANLGKSGRKNTLETKIKMSNAAKLRWQKYHDAKR